jgi:hypothetical protein
MEKHVSTIAKSCFHIRNIGRAYAHVYNERCLLTLMNSLVTSILEYGNAMLYGLPANITNKLQCVQKTAARIISGAKKHDHITPTLVTLHWLPVHYLCQYRILVYVFNCPNGNTATDSFLPTNVSVTIRELCVAGPTSRWHEDILREMFWQICCHTLKQFTWTFEKCKIHLCFYEDLKNEENLQQNSGLWSFLKVSFKQFFWIKFYENLNKKYLIPYLYLFVHTM